MTTTVIIRANHGWSVDVTQIRLPTKEIEGTTRVEPNTEQTFHVHNGRDLLIHEVQPSEIEKATEGENASA